MKLFDKIMPSFKKGIEKKDFIPGTPFFGAFLQDGGWYDLIAYQALLYYRQIAPIYTGINIIADEFANIKPRVYDKKNKEFIDHDVLALLDHPFADTTWEEFAKEFAVYYLVTGNNYTVLTGAVERPPVEMMNIYPSAINIVASQTDGYNLNYNVTTSISTEEFTRNEKIVPGYFRYVNKFGNKEMWQTKSFNARYQIGYGQYGMSSLTPIYYELFQHLYASIHNQSLLKNGAKIDTVFSLTGPGTMRQDAFERLQNQLKAFYSGPQNAGRVMLAENNLTVSHLSGNSIVDMDFLNLKQEVTNAIYNSLKVPLALISGDHSTMNNIENSITMLYDRAVLPLTNRILKELTLLLMPRYKNSEDYCITYKQDDITALEPRKISQINTLKLMGVLTINEVRGLLGYDEIEGGDNIFVPSLDVPLSSFGSDDSAAKSYISSLNDLRFKDGKKLIEMKGLLNGSY